MLAKSPEYRRNEMIMLEEFRRRKNVKTYIDARTKLAQKENPYEPEAYDYTSEI